MIEENLDNRFKERLNKIEVEINNPKFGYINKLKGLDRIEEYLITEMNFWRKYSSKSDYMRQYTNYYDRVLGELKSFYINYSKAEEPVFNSNWNPIKTRIANNFIDGDLQLLHSGTPATEFILNLLAKNSEQAYAAQEFIIERPINVRNRDFLIGYFKAHDFLNDKRDINDKMKESEVAFNTLLNELKNKTNEVHTKFHSTTTELSTWKENFIEEVKKWQETKVKAIDELYSEKNNVFINLEEAYSKRLQLEGPVTFWSKRVSKYRLQGIIWTSLLTILIVALLLLFKNFIYNPPESFNANLFAGNPSAIKAVLILAAIISFAVFLLRVFSKMVYSSFHLMRDSEEREQLTLVYIALVKEGKIDLADRKLVFEALFSRADTGLLGGDSGPTMPGGLTNIIGALSGKK